MCQHHYFSLIINEKEWKNTHRNRCAKLSLRFYFVFFLFFLFFRFFSPTQCTILSNLRKLQMVMPVWGREGQRAFNEVIVWEVQCINKRRRLLLACQIKPLGGKKNTLFLVSETEIIWGNVFWQSSPFVRKIKATI